MKTSFIRKIWIGALTLLFLIGGMVWGQEAIVDNNSNPNSLVVEEANSPLIEMAILLDTSGSMSGLIDQARAELWAIVNEFIFSTKYGRRPELWVGLYEYGKSSLPSKTGYIRQICPLTRDLDKVSEELFALETRGGSEYCGWVIQEATKSLRWSDSPDDLKVIFIAGNEPFTQGPVDYRKACKEAITKGLIVNTIHCGGESIGISGKWKEGALLADGRFMNINQNKQVVHIQAPQDKNIAALGRELNTTYLAYGARGKESAGRQKMQDKNAATVSEETAIQRSLSKASHLYRNDAWDLVDAVNNDTVKLADLEKEALPENMQKMSDEEREAYISSMTKKRVEIQQKIQKLNEERKKYVAEQKKILQGKDDTLGSAIICAIREQLRSKNFTFESENKKPEDSGEKNSKDSNKQK